MPEVILSGQRAEYTADGLGKATGNLNPWNSSWGSQNLLELWIWRLLAYGKASR